jgi:exonuclease III
MSYEEPHATARAELNAHLARSGFIDIYRQLHPGSRGYTWYARKLALAACAERRPQRRICHSLGTFRWTGQTWEGLPTSPSWEGSEITLVRV